MIKKEKLPETGLPLETMLKEQIYDALQGEMVEFILKEAKVRKTENYWRYILEGHSFKVEEKISGKLYKLFHDVKKSLGFEENVDFYITSSAEVNAWALASAEEDEPHIININSSLLQLMSDDELKFIIGHEIGHLITKNAELMRLIHFIFPNQGNLPGILQHKVRLWGQLSELIADRYGYIACPDLPSCISAFFKMSSGLDSKRVDLDVHAFMEENEERLQFFLRDTGINVATHPINPVRVKAIDLFSRSAHFAAPNATKDVSLCNEELQKQMDELIQVLLRIKSSMLDYHITHFIAAAGLLVANLDGEISEREIEAINVSLSDFTIFPGRFLQNLYESEKVAEVFNDSIKNILEINPAEKERLLGFMIEMALADKKIQAEEINFIFNLGHQGFGYSHKEVAQIFAGMIQQRFMPCIQHLS